MGQEVEVDAQLGDEWKGYIFKIMGGNDKQGFQMKQGVLLKGRTRLLMKKGQSCFRPRREGEKIRKTVRGCIVGQDIRALFLTIVKKGEAEVAGLTDTTVPRRLGPKRVNKLKKLFGMKKEDSSVLLKKNAIRRTWTAKNGKERQKAPKIQRLVTDVRIRNKKMIKIAKSSGYKKTAEFRKRYEEVLAEYNKKRAEKKERENKKKEEVEKKQKDEKEKAKKVVETKKEAPKQAAKKENKKAEKVAPKKK